MIQLEKVREEEGVLFWEMQRKAFAYLLDKYQDFDTNPGNETLEKVLGRIHREDRFAFFIKKDGVNVGGIVVAMWEGDEKRISPIFVLPEYRNQGIAQAAIRELERMFGKEKWALETIKEEKNLCYLYEKMGYIFTGKQEKIQDQMTLVLYYK